MFKNMYLLIMSEIRNLTRNGETFYPLTTSSAVINEATGEGMVIDDEPTAGSDNLVKSGGIVNKISRNYINANKVVSINITYDNRYRVILDSYVGHIDVELPSSNYKIGIFTTNTFVDAVGGTNLVYESGYYPVDINRIGLDITNNIVGKYLTITIKRSDDSSFSDEDKTYIDSNLNYRFGAIVSYLQSQVKEHDEIVDDSLGVIRQKNDYVEIFTTSKRKRVIFKSLRIRSIKASISDTDYEVNINTTPTIQDARQGTNIVFETPYSGKYQVMDTDINASSRSVYTAVNVKKRGDASFTMDDSTLLSILDITINDEGYIDESGVFNVSRYNAVNNNYTTYPSLQYALSDIPVQRRKGGICIKYISSISSEYEQFHLITNEWSDNVNNWIEDKLFVSTKTNPNTDLDISDDNNNTLARFSNGHIKTKNFDSKITIEKLDYCYEKVKTENVLENYENKVGELLSNIAAVRKGNMPVFALITDTHYGDNYGSIQNETDIINKHSQVFVKLAKKVGVDAIIHLGDMVSCEVYNNKPDCLGAFIDYIETFKQSKEPLIYSLAHHELFDYGIANLNRSTSIIDITQQLNINDVLGNTDVSSYLDFHKMIGNPNYYYVDFPTKKIRYINLTTSDYSETNKAYYTGLSEEQLVWLRDTAIANVPSGYGVLIGGHSPLCANLSRQGTLKTYGLSTFEQGIDIAQNSLTLDGIINNAIENGINVLTYFSGHRHSDNVWALVGSNYPNVIFDCDVPVKGPSAGSTELGYPERYTRTLGNISEYSQNFMCIDTENNIVYIFRFGAGYNRTIYCRNKQVEVNSTLDLTQELGTSLSYQSLDTTIATISNGIVSGVAAGQTQVIAYDSSTNTKTFITIKVV